MKAIEGLWRRHHEWAQQYLKAAEEANSIFSVLEDIDAAIRNLVVAKILVKAGRIPGQFATSRHNGDGMCLTDFVPEPDLQHLGMTDEVPCFKSPII